MELYSVNFKPYKTIYRVMTIFSLLAIIAGYLLVANGFYILPPGYNPKNITRPVIIALVLGSFLHARYYGNRIKQLGNYTDFEEKLLLHIKIYKARMLWFIIAAGSAVILYVVSTHIVFLYLAIFDFVISLASWPNKVLMQKELKNDEIIFIE